MREDVRNNLNEQLTKPTAREILLSLSVAMPLGDRLEPMRGELIWVLMGKQKPEEHELILPAYCYAIFDKVARTIFQAFPLMSDTVFCPDPSKLAHVKTYEEAKQFFRLDWYRFGKLIGILLRMIRFINLEAEAQVKKDGLWELEPQKEKDILTILGPEWLEKKGVPLAGVVSGDLSAALIQTFKGIVPDGNAQQIWSQIAYHFGPEAMSEFNRGIADGIPGFIDEQGELTGETSATNNYAFALILWPEIKAFLERDPLPNRTEVFKWITQFHDAGLIVMPNLEHFHNFCESIGLKFTGRIPKKS